ncbi:MAG TPA: ThiF family adenylyltransferase [Alphaproteobacteria bacterium]|nr:ThiF family adenylyltransferase [Alphaproteobacteria bacterium]
MTQAPINAPITGETRLFVIIGHPVAQVKSPMTFNPLFHAAGRNAVMVPIDVAPESLEAAFAGLKTIANLDGIVVTVPHKPRMAALVDEALPTGRMVGAINAARRERDGRWVGDMFDGRGCVHGLRAQRIEPKGRKVLLVGAGGAGSAIAFAMAEAGVARLTVFDVDQAKAARVVEGVRRAHPAVLADAGPPVPKDHDTIVNATPMGMLPSDPLPVDPAVIEVHMLVVDVIMKPEVTPLLKAAQAKGCRIQPGRHMLEGQVAAVAAFFGL